MLREKCPIRSFSGPYFPTFGLNTKRYGVSLHIQYECGKLRTRKTPNADTFCVVRKVTMENQFWRTSILQNLEFVKFILVSDAQRILFVQLISRHTVQWSSVNFFSLVLKLPS